MSNKKIAIELGNEMKESFERWNYIFEHGSSDPFWSDGINLNLVRNHILYYRRQCEENLTEEEYPPEYWIDPPPKVDVKLIVRADEIRVNAKRSLEIYMNDKNFLYLRDVLKQMNDKQKKDTLIESVLGYVTGLAMAINEDQLVDMRRHEDATYYQDAFVRCRKRVEEIMEVPKEKEFKLGQLTLFDLFETEMMSGGF